MYNFSFICRASKIDKKGFAPIELSIIINGTRTYVILPMKYEPTLFNKMMTSKKNNEVLEYTSSVRTKLNKCIAEMTANNIAITAHSLKEYFKNGGIKTYLLFDIAEEFLEYHSKKTANCASEVMKKYRLAIDKFKKFIGNVELKTITPQHIEEFKIELKQTYKFEGSKEQELFEYADTSLDARKEVLRHLLNTNKLSFNSVQQAVNFIAIMLGKEKIQDIIKTEIDKVISETHKVGNDKKGRNPR